MKVTYLFKIIFSFQCKKTLLKSIYIYIPRQEADIDFPLGGGGPQIDFIVVPKPLMEYGQDVLNCLS